KQLLKLPDVLEVEDLAYHDCVSRELVLLVVKLTETTRTEILSVCEVFEAKIADLTHTSLTIEYSGNSRKVNAIVEIMSKYGVEEIVRTGQIAIRYRSLGS
ncbi:acetolactate synthase small subunit, partial [Leptospira interrogans serovar Pomona]